MRKIILMVSLLLISGAAEAGQMRGLTLASNAPAAEQTQQTQPSVPPQQAQPPVRTENHTATKTDTKAEQACGTREQSRSGDDRHNRRPMRHHESAEHKARRIAAHYGIYW
jgi:hypothetical protein